MIFRKVGGFVYVMSVLVSMEGALADPPVSQWHTGQYHCRLLSQEFTTGLWTSVFYPPLLDLEILSVHVFLFGNACDVQSLVCFLVWCGHFIHLLN